MAYLKIDPNASAGFGGKEYKADKDGLVEIPDEFAAEAKSHGEIVDAAEAKMGKIDRPTGKRG